MGQPNPGSTGTDATFAGATLGAFREGVDLLEQGIENLQNAMNGVIDAVRDFFQRVQDWIDEKWFVSKAIEAIWGDTIEKLEAIGKLITAAQGKVNEILDKLQKSLNGSFPVMSLFDVALQWGTTVKTKLSDISPDLTPSGAIDAWRGPAHETFKTRVQDQTDAVDATVGKVGATSLWLSGVAAANLDYVGDLIGSCSDLIGELIQIGADVTETAAGDAAAVLQISNHASETTGSAATTVLNFIAALASRLGGVLDKINELANEYGDHTGLPNGEWPQSVSRADPIPA